MKQKILVGLIAAMASAGAFAQSNVTVYGLIDLSVNYTTNQDSHGNAVWSLGDSNAGTGAGDGGQGAMSGSRIGFKGEEDLGGGNKALFKMESGFTANNGVSDQQGQLFGRQVFAGLSNKDLGQLTFGRQYGIMTDVAFDFDPLGVGNYSANEWEVFLFGVRFDNTIWYKNQVGPVQVNVQYSMGGVAGSTSQGSTEGFSVKYNQGPLGLAGAYQQSTDANSNNLSVGSLDGTFNFGPATVFLDYYHIKTDAGFAKAGSHSGGPLGTTSMLIVNSAATDRKDQLWTLGLAYNFTPAVTLTVAYMDDQISQDVVGDGSMKSAYALLEYHLSKRTEVYATVDRSTASGQALTTAASGSGTLNGIGAGETASSAVAAGLRVTF